MWRWGAPRRWNLKVTEELGRNGNCKGGGGVMVLVTAVSGLELKVGEKGWTRRVGFGAEGK